MTMQNDSRIALNRVQLRESYVMRETSDIFVSHLTTFAQTAAEKGAGLEAAAQSALESAYGYGPQREDRKPFVYQDGIAIIPIHGALLNRFSGSWGFVTGYQYIRRMMNAALEDEDVQLIVYDVDSPGGEAAGCFELANEIRASRTVKPSLAVVDALSASAGYALASAATQMVATPSSKIGSIGVVRMHIDLSGALEQAGVKITLIEAPEDGMKTAGSPFQPLSDEAQKDWQNQVNRAYDDFVALIVANRGLGDGEVRETKARVFRSDEALALRLIDAVKTPTEAVSSFLAELAESDDPAEEDDDDMSTAAAKPGSEATSGQPAAPAAAAAPAVDQTAINNAVADALRADRERQASIKALPEAAERPKLADHLALSGATVESAKATLAVAGVETKAAPSTTPTPPAAGASGTQPVDSTNHLAAAMDATKQPDVGAGAEQGGQPGAAPSDSDLSAAILKDQGAMTGRVYGEAKPAA